MAVAAAARSIFGEGGRGLLSSFVRGSVGQRAMIGAAGGGVMGGAYAYGDNSSSLMGGVIGGALGGAAFGLGARKAWRGMNKAGNALRANSGITGHVGTGLRGRGISALSGALQGTTGKSLAANSKWAVAGVGALAAGAGAHMGSSAFRSNRGRR